jgi:RNA ligase (TIGR02306 family)
MPSELIVEVCKIEQILPHNNADRLELAIVKGWQVIVGKGVYQVGDKVVYIPIDSILSQVTEEKLFPVGSKVTLDKSRVRTIRLRKEYSQGMVAPLDMFEISPTTQVGTDVKDILGITKFSPPPQRMPSAMQTGGRTKAKGNENFRRYTGINHLANYPWKLKDMKVIVHEKIHGTNWRAGYTKCNKGGWLDVAWNWVRSLTPWPKSPVEFVYGSHNVQLQNKSKSNSGFYPSNVYYEIVEKYGIEEKLKEFFPDQDIVLYGEVYGDGIQKNYTYGCEQGERKLVLFDVMVDGNLYTGPYWVEHVAEKLGLGTCPALYIGDFDMDKIKAYLEGPSILCPEQKVREGLVVRSMYGMGTTNRPIFKWISPAYLMQKNNTEWT